jgi:ORF6N domain
MKKTLDVIPVERLAQSIYVIRGEKVMLDSDLADLYAVPTRTLLQAVKRHSERFPKDFMFQLDNQEFANLRSQIVISSLSHGGRRHLPHVFTEQGVAMLSSVLNSNRAARVNIAIMRTFIRLREVMATNQDLARKFNELEARVGGHDGQIAEIIEAIRQLIAPPDADSKKEMGFHIREKSPPYRVRKTTKQK